jgi:hypothetical protein
MLLEQMVIMYFEFRRAINMHINPEHGGRFSSGFANLLSTLIRFAANGALRRVTYISHQNGTVIQRANSSLCM